MSPKWVIGVFASATILATAFRAGAQDALSLAKAVRLGRQRAPEIGAAHAAVDQAEAETSLARAGYLPTLTASVTGQGIALHDTPIRPPGTLGSSVVYTGVATGAGALRWNIYDFGKTGNAVDAAEANVHAANASADNAATNFTGAVASTYVTLAFREELAKAASLTVTQRDRLFGLATALAKQGLQPPVEELRAESRLEAARRVLAIAEMEALDARQALSALIGSNDFHVERPRLPVVDADVARAMKTAEAQRETIRAAHATVEARRQAKDAARSRYLPTLSITADASYRFAETDAAPLMTNARTGTASVVLSGPLFDASVGAGVDRADAASAAAEAQLTQATRDARTEAARSAVTVRGAERAIEHAKKAEEQATMVFKLVQARYERGLATPAELIDAETSDVDARTTRTTVEMTHALAVVRLLVATGQSARLLEEVSR